MPVTCKVRTGLRDVPVEAPAETNPRRGEKSKAG